jgi:hypothetical protein
MLKERNLLAKCVPRMLTLDVELVYQAGMMGEAMAWEAVNVASYAALVSPLVCGGMVGVIVTEMGLRGVEKRARDRVSRRNFTD